jgi:hypothetical protein
MDISDRSSGLTATDMGTGKRESGIAATDMGTGMEMQASGGQKFMQ